VEGSESFEAGQHEKGCPPGRNREAVRPIEILKAVLRHSGFHGPLLGLKDLAAQLRNSAYRRVNQFA
jgi:hypothetical protein